MRSTTVHLQAVDGVAAAGEENAGIAIGVIGASAGSGQNAGLMEVVLVVDMEVDEVEQVEVDRPQKLRTPCSFQLSGASNFCLEENWCWGRLSVAHRELFFIEVKHFGFVVHVTSVLGSVQEAARRYFFVLLFCFS